MHLRVLTTSKSITRWPLAGEVATAYADINKAEEELGFKAQYNINDMCRDSWNFILKKLL